MEVAQIIIELLASEKEFAAIKRLKLKLDSLSLFKEYNLQQLFLCEFLLQHFDEAAPNYRSSLEPYLFGIGRFVPVGHRNAAGCFVKGLVHRINEFLKGFLVICQSGCPDDPISNGVVTDQVNSYFAMRKISTKRDQNGIVRLELNNKAYFQFGPLDQGWWPDGLYTAPSDEALKYDIQKTKDFGFNMICKHVKVEPARWYTHCDQLGILVWQDMPSGDESPQWQHHNYFNGNELNRSLESENNYRKEWKEIMDYLISNPCIVAWVPFNEAWGQFKTAEIVEWTKTHDPSRLVNPASGGNHYPVGDMLDLHNYPGPEMYLYDGQRPTVLGEYGGIGLALEGHLWASDKNWGYVQFKNSKEVTDEYVKYGEALLKMIKTGFSAGVYTQTTDVEGEVNGLLTYDRKVIKIDEKRVREINQKICKSLNE